MSTTINEEIVDWRTADGRLGAEWLQSHARLYADLLAEQEQAARRWADEWTAQFWRPWSGWLVRYAPVMPSLDAELADALIQKILILDELQSVIAQSPGASVQAVSLQGRLHEKVIGAFIDAEPVEFAEPSINGWRPYHESYKALTHNGSYNCNVPPGTPPPPPPPPYPPSWYDYLSEQRPDLARNWAEVVGVERIARSSGEELAELSSVRDLGWNLRKSGGQ
jgi:hypothetical protein